VPKNAALDAVLEWLRKHAVLLFPNWIYDMSNSTIPHRFDRMLNSFFSNMRSLYTQGQLKTLITEEFWPWFVGVLEVEKFKPTVPAQHAPISFNHDAETPAPAVSLGAFQLKPSAGSNASDTLIRAHSPSSPSPHQTKHENLKEIRRFETLDEFKKMLMAGNDVGRSSTLDTALRWNEPDVLHSVNLAVDHYELIRTESIKPLAPHRHTIVRYTRKQCSGMIFGIIMGAYSKSKGAHEKPIWIKDILEGKHGWDAKVAKLRCFIAYWISLYHLSKTSQSQYKNLMEKDVTFEIKSLGRHVSAEHLIEQNKDTSLIRVAFAAGDMSENEHGNLFVDFANKDIGGGVLGNGSVQEEIEFCRRPECLVSILISPRMESGDVIFLCDTIATSKTRGYAMHFKFDTIMSPQELKKQSNRPHDIVAMDATSFKTQNPLSDTELEMKYTSNEHISRDFVKCYMAALGPKSLLGKPLHIVTGAWGTGDFSGTKNTSMKDKLREFKQAIQIAAVTVAFKERGPVEGTNSLTYYDLDRMSSKYNTVGDILKIMK